MNASNEYRKNGNKDKRTTVQDLNLQFSYKVCLTIFQYYAWKG